MFAIPGSSGSRVSLLRLPTRRKSRASKEVATAREPSRRWLPELDPPP